MTARALIRLLLLLIIGLFTAGALIGAAATAFMLAPPPEDQLTRVSGTLDAVALGDPRHHSGHRAVIQTDHGPQPVRVRFDLIAADQLAALRGAAVTAELDDRGRAPEILGLSAGGRTIIGYAESRARRLEEGRIFIAVLAGLALIGALLFLAIWRRL